MGEGYLEMAEGRPDDDVAEAVADEADPRRFELVEPGHQLHTELLGHVDEAGVGVVLVAA